MSDPSPGFLSPFGRPDGPPAWREDALLGGRVRLLQPLEGYRAALDPVLLAAAADPAPGARVLDAGTGTGAALLCLAARRPDLDLTGLELQALPAALAAMSLARTGGRGRIWAGDLGHPPPELGPAFDMVITNPPYRAAGTGTEAPHTQRRRAHHETPDMPLARWIACCLALLKPRGRLLLIQRADRLDAIVSALDGRAGDLTVFPLWPRAGQPAHRVIVAARKGGRGPLRLLSGLCLHETNGSRYTPAAEAVLRDAAPLDLDPRGRR